MFPIILLILILVVSVTLFRKWFITIFHRNKLPPGPTPLPIIGSIHLLGSLPHRALHKLSQKYGSIMSIRLGDIETVVLSSPDAAKIFLGTHDAVFSSRPQNQGSEYFSYESKGIAFTEYGEYWRSVRKLCTEELLSSAKINAFAEMRREAVGLTVEDIKTCSANNEVVNLTEIVGRLLEKMTFNMLFGRKAYEGTGFRRIVEESSEVMGAFNLGDYVPMLAPLDLQGLTRRIKSLSKECDKMLETLINDHEQNTNTSLQKPNQIGFMDILLSLETKHSNTANDISHAIDRTQVKAILLDMIIGVVETSTTSIEWVLSVLLKYPRVMNKLQQELKDVLGNKLVVDETDLKKLSYLHMVIKETFRIYPTASFIPRESTKDVVINGYHIPKKTRVLVNLWAFGRDSKVWSENWDKFFPERFLEKDVDLRGHDFEFIPFGSGRRRCAGMNLGLINTGLVVSQLVHSFNWDLPNGMSPADLDMNERLGLTMPRAKPLIAIPTYRH